jgi:hypothetical protein
MSYPSEAGSNLLPLWKRSLYVNLKPNSIQIFRPNGRPSRPMILEVYRRNRCQNSQLLFAKAFRRERCHGINRCPDFLGGEGGVYCFDGFFDILLRKHQRCCLRMKRGNRVDLETLSYLFSHILRYFPPSIPPYVA